MLRNSAHPLVSVVPDVEVVPLVRPVRVTAWPESAEPSPLASLIRTRPKPGSVVPAGGVRMLSVRTREMPAMRGHETEMETRLYATPLVPFVQALTEAGGGCQATTRWTVYVTAPT